MNSAARTEARACYLPGASRQKSQHFARARGQVLVKSRRDASRSCRLTNIILIRTTPEPEAASRADTVILTRADYNNLEAKSGTQRRYSHIPPLPLTTTISPFPLLRYASPSLLVYLISPFRFYFWGGGSPSLSFGCILWWVQSLFYHEGGGGRRTRPSWHLMGQGLDGGGCGP